MSDDFLASIDGSDLTREKVSEQIGNALRGLFKEKEPPGISKEFIQKECERLTPSFLELTRYYTSSKHEETHERIIRRFLLRYDSFTWDFEACIKSLQSNWVLCFFITYVWCEVLKELEEKAANERDTLARSIAIQLQTDLNYITTLTLVSMPKGVSGFGQETF